ncbi:MAG: efflux transporter outer membrane subunit [Janthinobacterium lividum]
MKSHPIEPAWPANATQAHGGPAPQNPRPGRKQRVFLRYRHALPAIAAGVAASLLLCSCASFKGIGSTSAMRAPAEFATTRTLPEQGGQWPEASWPLAIGGPALMSLIDEAFASNPSLQVATARLAQARALALSAGAASRPTVSANFTGTYQRFTENGLVPVPLAGTYQTDSRLSLDFSYDLDFWGRHGAELRAALSQGQAASAEQQAARLMISTSIARAWVQLARQQATLDLIARQVALREMVDRLTQLRIKSGLDPRSDNEQAVQQLASLRFEQALWQEQSALTRNQLAALLGQGPDRGLQIAAPSLPEAATLALPDNLPLALLAHRPDIVAARWRAQAAVGEIDSARAQFYPNVNLVAFAGLSSLGLDRLLDSGSRIVGAGPAISLPVLETGALRAQLQGRYAASDAAIASYNQTLNDALHDVADQVMSSRAALEQERQQQTATQSAGNTLRLARERERAGTTNMLPVLASEMALLTQQKSALDTTARRADLRIGLIRALGGGFVDDSQPPDSRPADPKAADSKAAGAGTSPAIENNPPNSKAAS